MKLKYTLDEGGLIREYKGDLLEMSIIFHGDRAFDNLNSWIGEIRKTRFNDVMALCPQPSTWRVELAPDVWVVSILLFDEDALVARYDAHNNILVANELYWRIKNKG